MKINAGKTFRVEIKTSVGLKRNPEADKGTNKGRAVRKAAGLFASFAKAVIKEALSPTENNEESS